MGEAIAKLQQEIKDLKLSEQSLRNRLKEVKRLLHGSISALVCMMEKADRHTARHQKRVAQLAFIMAKELGFTSEEAYEVLLAALVHDIGKISISAEVLTKPGKLLPYEWESIRAHPVVGFNIMNNFNYPWPVPMIIKQHHERRNGSGYPDGINKHDILRPAMVLAVADVFEAMFSHRPYRPALGIDPALAEISKADYYDPEVAAVCSDLFLKQGFCFEQH